MRTIVILIMMLIPPLCTGCHSAFASNTYIIKGIAEKRNGVKIYFVNHKILQECGRATIVNDTFEFRGKADEEPGIYMITDSIEVGLEFILEPGEILIQIPEEGPLTATGTPLNDAKTRFSEKWAASYEVAEEIYHRISPFKSDAMEVIAEYKAEIEKVEKVRIGLIKSYFEQNYNNILAIDAIMQTQRLLPNHEILEYINKLSPPQSNELAITNLKNKITTELKALTVEGEPFTDFTIDTGSTKASLSDYAGKGKYLLVQFWSSDCDSSRAQIPNLIKVYDFFKDKNVEILGVDLSQKRENSKKAIKELGITWPQIVNAQNNLAYLYSFEKTPYFILLGPDGTILKRGLQGEEIQITLAQVLGLDLFSILKENIKL